MITRTAQHPVDAAQQAPSIPNRDYGWFYPRWAVLAGILLVPTGIIGELINVYYANHLCSFGQLCTIDETSGLMQIVIIWAAFLGLWGLAFAIGRKPLVENLRDHTYGPSHPVSNFFWHLSHFERVTPFIYGIGILAFLGMVIAQTRARLDPAVFALGVVAATVAIVTAVWWLRLLNQPYRRPAAQTVAIEPETAAPGEVTAADLIAPLSYPDEMPLFQPSAPNYAAMPNYGDVPPSQYVPDAPPPTGATLVPDGLPSAPRLASLEPPPNPNVDLSGYDTPPTGPATRATTPLPPQMAPLHPDVEAH